MNVISASNLWLKNFMTEIQSNALKIITAEPKSPACKLVDISVNFKRKGECTTSNDFFFLVFTDSRGSVVRCHLPL